MFRISGRLAVTIGVMGILAACSREEILPGLREDPRSDAPQEAITPEEEAAMLASGVVLYADAEEQVNRAEPIRLPAAVTVDSWTHRAGSATHRLQNYALSAAPAVAWSAKIGQGEDRKHRITAEPVSDGSRIFTLDSRALVTATSIAGATLWSVDLTPASEKTDDASGGGLALADGALFVTTGFGELIAIDTASGAISWRQKLDSPVSGAPSVSGGLVYVTTDDNRGWAVDAQSGRVKWALESVPSSSGMMGVAAPVLADRLVIFPFGSGELTAALRKGGVRTWSTMVSGSRPGRAYSILSDISGEPVYANGVIYVGNPVGQSVALNMSGERLWTANEGAQGPMLVIGGSVFLVSDESRLVRLDAASGETIWGVDLPGYTKDNPKKRKGIYSNFGPIMAGGVLWIASSDGLMRGFSPEDGTLVSSVSLPDGAASRPIVVNGTAYLVTTKGALLALR